MTTPLEFEYSLRLFDGRYLRRCIGTDWQDAARRVGIAAAEVRRSMPTSRVLTEAERLERNKRLAELRKNKQKEIEE